MIEDINCRFCQNHEEGDTLYESADWDGGIGFDYIRDIKFCPLCGRKLRGEEDEEPTFERTDERCGTCIYSSIDDPPYMLKCSVHQQQVSSKDWCQCYE